MQKLNRINIRYHIVSAILINDLLKYTKMMKRQEKNLAKKKNKLKVIFLGGVGEIGKNMTLLEYGSNILVIDAGMTFPNEQMPGIDYVIPDYNYLLQNKEKVAAIVITHGHEDHIGALHFVLRDINAPVYGSKLSLALLEHKLAGQGERAQAHTRRGRAEN